MSSWVYIIKVSLQEAYKIGYAKDVDQRLRHLQMGNPNKLEVIHKFETENALVAERVLHKLFENKNIHGEWYQLDSIDIAFLTRINGYTKAFTWNSQLVNLEDITTTSLDLDMFSILVDNIPTAEGLQTIQVTERQIREFVSIAERREAKGKHAFSRNYWTKHRNPRLRMPLYCAIIKLLYDNNLILNRSERRSGNLALNSSQCIAQIKKNMSNSHT